jgi:hypothetical protein
MKVAGLGNSTLPVPAWYLLEVKGGIFRNIGKDHPKIEVTFEVAVGPHTGKPIIDDFMLSVKAISRIRAFLSKSGYSKDLLASDDLEPEQMVGLKVWAKIIEDNYGLKTDGWNFRAENDPPEGEAAIDYTARDAAEVATGALKDLD